MDFLARTVSSKDKLYHHCFSTLPRKCHQEGLKLNGTHHLLFHADVVNLLAKGKVVPVLN
jgi:hypothetical protein